MTAPRPGPIRTCPALLIGAPASGQGKTTFTAALARYHRDRGRRVRVFKTGPDFLDPLILAHAAGQPVFQLDLWMGGEDHCRGLLYDAAAQADVILVEGVMGLFDGTPSSADLAARFDLPVLAVIDGAAMAQTFGAVAEGLARHRPGLRWAGVAANRVGSAGHAQMLADSLPRDLPGYGWLAGSDAFALPDRHLGLCQPDEVADFDARLARAAAALQDVPDVLPPVATFPPAASLPPSPARLDGVRIAVARDAAFAFVYPTNLDTLRSLGARLTFFSPLTDPTLPPCDSLYLPGGYPELHLATLTTNQTLTQALHAHHRAGKPILAECGGMLYLLDSLRDTSGREAPMAGLLAGHAALQQRLVHLGLHQARLPEGTLRGHSFHHARLQTDLAALASSTPAHPHSTPEAIYRRGRLTASFIHWYFPSNPAAAAALLRP